MTSSNTILEGSANANQDEIRLRAVADGFVECRVLNLHLGLVSTFAVNVAV